MNTYEWSRRITTALNLLATLGTPFIIVAFKRKLDRMNEEREAQGMQIKLVRNGDDTNRLHAVNLLRFFSKLSILDRRYTRGGLFVMFYNTHPPGII